MRIVIYGAGEIGCMIATEFYEDHDITIIDMEEARTEAFNRLDIGFVTGNASSISVLKEAQIDDADVFIACTDYDEANIVACLTAKRISGVRTICFVSKEEYHSSVGLRRDSEYPCDLYIDCIIWPEELLTQEIFRIITVAKALDVENFAGGRARLLEYRLNESSPLVGNKICSCNFPDNTLLVGVTRDSELFIPSGDTVLQTDDKVICMGSSSSLDILAGRFFHDKEFVKNVAIIGGGTVGLRLAKNLEKLKIRTKIFEKNVTRCEVLASELENTLVINGDGTNLELLNEEGIEDFDVVVSVTNNDEKNLLCSLLAKQCGVKRVVTRVSNNVNVPLFEKVGIDIAISSNIASLKEIRNDLSETDVDILATVEQGKGEVLEIEVPQGFVERKIMDLKLPVKAIVAIIQRRNKVIIPKGDTLVMVGDTLITFTTKENSAELKNYFKV